MRIALLRYSLVLMMLLLAIQSSLEQQQDQEWYSSRDGRNVILHMSDGSTRSSQKDQRSLKVLSFCVGCPDPSSEGSIVNGLLNYHNLYLDFSLTSELVWAIPNYADSKKLLNVEQLKNRVAMVKRGRNSLFDKVEKIMLRSEALGVIVVDDGQCDENFLWCGPRAGNVKAGGFSAYDDEDIWEGLNIPVVMVTAATGNRFTRMMSVREVDVLGMEERQLMTILDPTAAASAATRSAGGVGDGSSGSGGGGGGFGTSTDYYSSGDGAMDGYDDSYYYYEDEL
jgi:hypothetical protein